MRPSSRRLAVARSGSPPRPMSPDWTIQPPGLPRRLRVVCLRSGLPPDHTLAKTCTIVRRHGWTAATRSPRRRFRPPSILLETRAVRPHAGSQSLGARRSSPTGFPSHNESPRPVAYSQDRCHRGRDDERLAARSGSGVAEVTLAQASSAPSKRVVPTRMLRGVRGGRSDPPAYPIERSLYSFLRAENLLWN